MDTREHKQTKGLNRDTIDKYYTKSSVVDWCLRIVNQTLEIQNDDLIVEPSAGDGAFIIGIKALTKNVRFYDLEPNHSEITKQDFLVYDYNDVLHTFKKIHVLGNPPFGRQSSLAIKFIKKSCQFCDSVSFILPRSFKKDSLKKTFPLNFHLTYEEDLPETSFLVDGVEHDVPCVFQIWVKGETNRIVNKKMEPVNFKFVEKDGCPDISFRRVGVNAGTIDHTIDKQSKQSHYFIQFVNENTKNENLNKLSEITYEFNNTVGPKSISKQELIAKFNGVHLS